MAQILGTGHQRSGKNARIKCGANGDALRNNTWNVNETADMLDTVNFESGEFDEGVTGIRAAEWSMRGAWDNSRKQIGDPPGIYPRDDLVSLIFYTNTSDNVSWTFPFARVRSATNGAEVRGLVTFEGSGMNQGTFTRVA